MKKQQLIVKQPEKAVPYEVMADSIVSISRFAKEINKSRLSEKAILVLVSHSTGESQKTIKNVLAGLEQLESEFVRR